MRRSCHAGARLNRSRHADLEEARRAIGAFVERFSRERLLERHGYRTPAAVRTSVLTKAP